MCFLPPVRQCCQEMMDCTRNIWWKKNTPFLSNHNKDTGFRSRMELTEVATHKKTLIKGEVRNSRGSASRAGGEGGEQWWEVLKTTMLN